ncbi:hypothetical protein [Nostoc sp.]
MFLDYINRRWFNSRSTQKEIKGTQRHRQNCGRKNHDGGGGMVR